MARKPDSAASDNMLGRGAAVQLIACTEFSLIAESVAQKADTIDTLDMLVSAIMEFALERGEKVRLG